MKQFIVVVLVLLATFAQASNPFLMTSRIAYQAPPRSIVFNQMVLNKPVTFSNSTDDNRAKYRGMKNAGVALIAVGAPVTGIGLVTMAVGAIIGVVKETPVSENTVITVGGALVGVGLASVVTGIPLLVIGRKKGRNRSGIPSSLLLNQSKNGFGLAYHF